MEQIFLQELKTDDDRVKVAIFMYSGPGDPVASLNKAVDTYVGHKGYNEFVDGNMDNPWVRVIIKGINEGQFREFNPETHRL